MGGQRLPRMINGMHQLDHLATHSWRVGEPSHSGVPPGEPLDGRLGAGSSEHIHQPNGLTIPFDNRSIQFQNGQEFKHTTRQLHSFGNLAPQRKTWGWFSPPVTPRQEANTSPGRTVSPRSTRDRLVALNPRSATSRLTVHTVGLAIQRPHTGALSRLVTVAQSTAMQRHASI
jgi:hypothetical protein